MSASWPSLSSGKEIEKNKSALYGKWKAKKSERGMKRKFLSCYSIYVCTLGKSKLKFKDFFIASLACEFGGDWRFGVNLLWHVVRKANKDLFNSSVYTDTYIQLDKRTNPRCNVYLWRAFSGTLAAVCS